MRLTNNAFPTTQRHWLTASLLLLLTLLSTALHADTNVRASVDRNRLSMDETLTLSLTADSMLFSDEPEVAALENDFHILNRQQSSRTNIINGSISSSRQWDLTLAPKREGEITIPAIRMGDKSTRPLTITVTRAPQGTANRSSDQQVWLEADITPRRAYVQQQLEYTVRLFSSVNFLDASLEQPEIDHALVESLGENRYRQRVDGRVYQVIERRYAVFPQRSGSLSIPALTLQARVESYRPSLLDPGRLVIKRSPPMEIQVQAPPASFDGALWLPAKNIELFEEWSDDPEQLQAGQSITRRVDIRAEGLMAAQLPKLPPLNLPGIKLYPDQPGLQNTTDESGLIGLRSESTAMIPTQPGDYTLPELRIAWWNTETNQPEVAVLPARTLRIAAAPGQIQDEATQPSIVAAPPTADNAAEIAPRIPAATSAQLFWLYGIIGALLLSNLVCLGLLIRQRRKSHQPEPPTPGQQGSGAREKAAYNALKKVVSQRADVATLRQALSDWGDAWQPGCGQLPRLAIQAKALAPYIEQLNRALYGNKEGGDIDGKGLLSAVENCRRESKRRSSDAPLPGLYERPLRS